MRARDVSVSLYDAGNGELRVWAATFTVKGSLARKDGKVDEVDRLRVQKAIQKVLEGATFPEE